MKAGDTVIKSMTGYGRAQKILNGRDILVEIRSVNHRYYEYSSRVPRAFNYVDEKLKALLKQGISRGKVEVNVTINNIEGRDTEIALNKGAAEEQVWDDVAAVAGEALDKFVSMRETEGEKLRNDVLEKSDLILKMVGQVEALSPKTVENYRGKLYQKLSELLESKDIDQQRILTEAAIFAEKIAVDEETVRLRSHVSQLRDMLDSADPIGRKLDFIVQEMNREVNTIGSKAQDLNITKIVVDMKAEIEKIREQIQNIE